MLESNTRQHIHDHSDQEIASDRQKATPMSDNGGLDDLDYKIVRCLQDNPRASYATIARIVEASEPTAKRRVKTLIESGVITPVMFPDITMLGFNTSAWVGINADQSKLADIAEVLAGFAETTMVCTTLGRYDIIVFTAQPSLEKLSAWLAEEVSTIPGVRNTEAFVATKVHKVLRSWRLSVDETHRASRPSPTVSRTAGQRKAKT